MNKIKEEISKLASANAKTNWTKGIVWAIFICFFLFLAADAYLLLRPLSPEVKNIIDSEVNSTNIIFDQNVLDSLKTKQGPEAPIISPTGKNPFTPL